MGGTGGQPELRPSLSDIVVFTNREGNIRVEPFKHQLVIRHTKPYTHWKNLRTIIEKVLQSYWKVSKESTTQSLQLIYVNKVDLPAGTQGAPKVISINDYFQLENSFKSHPTHLTPPSFNDVAFGSFHDGARVSQSVELLLF